VSGRTPVSLGNWQAEEPSGTLRTSPKRRITTVPGAGDSRLELADGRWCHMKAPGEVSLAPLPQLPG
jgi:hypothetical protein